MQMAELVRRSLDDLDDTVLLFFQFEVYVNRILHKKNDTEKILYTIIKKSQFCF